MVKILRKKILNTLEDIQITPYSRRFNLPNPTLKMEKKISEKFD